MADDRRTRPRLAAALSLPAVAAVSLGFLLPVLWLARMSVNPTEPGGVLRDGWTAQHYAELVTDSFYAELTLASLQMSAVDLGDDFLCNGTKLWTTHAQEANWIFCLVRTSKESIPQKGITFLLIDMTSPGITVRPFTSTVLIPFGTFSFFRVPIALIFPFDI